jgi:hypothetical protein
MCVFCLKNVSHSTRKRLFEAVHTEQQLVRRCTHFPPSSPFLWRQLKHPFINWILRWIFWHITFHSWYFKNSYYIESMINLLIDMWIKLLLFSRVLKGQNPIHTWIIMIHKLDKLFYELWMIVFERSLVVQKTRINRTTIFVG